MKVYAKCICPVEISVLVWPKLKWDCNVYTNNNIITEP